MANITPETLFWAFIFAAIAFLAMIVYFRCTVSGLYGQIVGLRNELSGARKELAAAEAGREKLTSAVNRLILRRDDLLACLNAARNDEEKVACIMRLMGEDQNG